MSVLRLEFLGFENISHRQRLKYYQFIALKHSVFNLYQRISSISLRKENVEYNFININEDLNLKKKVLFCVIVCLKCFLKL